MLKYFKDGVSGNVTIIKQEIVTVMKTNKVSNFLSSPYVVTSKTAAVQKTVLNLVLIKHTHRKLLLFYWSFFMKTRNFTWIEAKLFCAVTEQSASKNKGILCCEALNLVEKAYTKD